MHVALLEGRPFTTTVPFGGDLASMRGVIHHGQSLTLTPFDQHGIVQAGDIVYVRWRGDNCLLHLVGEVAGDTLLIMYSQGGSNGWIGTSDVVAVVTKMSTPEQPASGRERLAELDAIIGVLVERVTEEDRELVGALVVLVGGSRPRRASSTSTSPSTTSWSAPVGDAPNSSATAVTAMSSRSTSIEWATERPGVEADGHAVGDVALASSATSSSIPLSSSDESR